jgi:hypothetical protein
VTRCSDTGTEPPVRISSDAMQIPLNLLTYDGPRRRLWIAGQRCHHGATGALLAASGAARAHRRPRRALAMAAAGSLLMAHDWKDRAVWFQRGWQDQP